MPIPEQRTFLDELLLRSRDASLVGYDNSESGLDATNVQAAIDEIAGGGGGGYPPTINSQTILGNAGGSSAAAAPATPNAFLFESDPGTHNSLRVYVAPQNSPQIQNIADTDTYGINYSLEDGFVYAAQVLAESIGTSGALRSKGCRVRCVKSSGALTLEAASEEFETGNGTGIGIEIVDNSGSLRFEFTNTTGELITLRAHISWTWSGELTAPA